MQSGAIVGEEEDAAGFSCGGSTVELGEAEEEERAERGWSLEVALGPGNYMAVGLGLSGTL